MFRGFLLALMALPAYGQSFNDYDIAPHDYFGATLTDPMSVLLKRLGDPNEALSEPNGKPLVRRLLKELGIPMESQVLVFTKTSLQRRVVNPESPRALYFNEDVYLGWMPNGRIEIASMDPKVGGVFYFQRPLDDSEQPIFHREESCLGCHAGSATNFLPGLLARSVFPDGNGRSLKNVKTFDRIGHQVPFDERWGGWLLSGEVGTARHMANALASVEDGKATLGQAKQPSKFFNAELHLRPDSDVLAMLLHDHQISMHHWMMEAHYRVRQGLHDAKVQDTSRASLEAIESGEREDLEACVDRLMRYLLFADEAPMGEESWKDGGDYRKVFLADRRQTVDGRSLKDLKLRERIFKYRCSYMIYSKAFAALPLSLREEVYHRLYKVLTNDADGFEHLGQEEREGILSILTETLPEAAAYWSREA
jgi:hypothetical protein